jgi:hypothetical protein
MNIQNINNKTIYQPKTIKDIKDLHDNPDELLNIDLIEMEINEGDWHSEHGIIVGSLIELAKIKNVIVLTTNKAVESILNSIR